MKKATMKDVAHAAGVSQSTVSFVMNDNTNMRIAQDTIDHVLKVADELGYVHRRSAASALIATDAETILVIVDEIATSPFPAITLQAIHETAWASGIRVRAVMTGASSEIETQLFSELKDRSYRGVIYASVVTRDFSPPEPLLNCKSILLNCRDPDAQLASVVPAERRGGAIATKTLIDAGHQRIAFIGGESWMDASRQRRQGYERAMHDAGREIDPSLIVEGNFMPSGGRRAMQTLLAAKQPPDAVFCGNDNMAIGAYDAIKEAGMRIPDDIAVMGYDDIELSQHLHPPLSTVELPHQAMGAWAVNYILGQRSPVQHRIECPLVLRGSH